MIYKKYEFNKICDLKTFNYLNRKLIDMKKRCYCKTNKDYRYYGKKGIKIDNRYLIKSNKQGLKNFIQDSIDKGFNFENGKISINRIDSNKGYIYSNIEYTTKEFNTRYINNNYYSPNKYSSINLYYKCNRNIEFETIKSRIKQGWNIDKILNTPTKKVIRKLGYFKMLEKCKTTTKRFIKEYEKFKRNIKDVKMLKYYTDKDIKEIVSYCENYIKKQSNNYYYKDYLLEKKCLD